MRATGCNPCWYSLFAGGPALVSVGGLLCVLSQQSLDTIHTIKRLRYINSNGKLSHITRGIIYDLDASSVKQTLYREELAHFPIVLLRVPLGLTNAVLASCNLMYVAHALSEGDGRALS